LREEAFCRKLVEQTVQELVGLDIVVNNVGKPGQPAELVSIYIQLAANSGSYATGQIYGSSGGKSQP